MWFKRQPDLKELQLFRSNVFVHVPQQQRRKWDAKGNREILVSYEENSKAYRIYYPNENMNVAHDADFRPKLPNMLNVETTVETESDVDQKESSVEDVEQKESSVGTLI